MESGATNIQVFGDHQKRPALQKLIEECPHTGIVIKLVPLSFQRAAKQGRKSTPSVIGIFNTPGVVSVQDEFAMQAFACPMDTCDLEFEEELELVRHQITEGHFKDKYCVLCDKWFTRRFDFKRHFMSMHENITYQCAECGKVFKRPDSHKNHLAKAHRNVESKTVEVGLDDLQEADDSDAV